MPKKLLIAIICSEALMTGVFLVWKSMNQTDAAKAESLHAAQYIDAAADAEAKDTEVAAADSIFNLRMAQAWRPDDTSFSERIPKHEAKLLRTLGKQETREISDRIDKLKKSLEIEDSTEVRAQLQEFDVLQKALNAPPGTALSAQYDMLTRALQSHAHEELQNRLSMMMARVRVALALVELERITGIKEKLEMLKSYQALRTRFRNFPVDRDAVVKVEPTIEQVDAIEQASRASGSVPPGEGDSQAQALLDQMEKRIMNKLRESETTVE